MCAKLDRETLMGARNKYSQAEVDMYVALKIVQLLEYQSV